VAAELAEQVEALADRGRVPGALQVDVGAVATGQVLDRGHRVGGGDVDREVGTGPGGQLELAGGDVERDDLGRVLGPCTGDHAQTDGAAPGHHDDVVELQAATLHRVQGTRQR